MFIAQHETVEYSIILPLPASEAFPLFTPEGERLWIEDWKPHYFYPANGETIVGMVFVTGEGDETTYWTVADFDNQAHSARYIRVTPGLRSVIVEVSCEDVGAQQTRVAVRYALTALSEAGNLAVASFVDAFEAMTEDWKAKILAYLERQPRRVSSTGL